MWYLDQWRSAFGSLSLPLLNLAVRLGSAGEWAVREARFAGWPGAKFLALNDLAESFGLVVNETLVREGKRLAMDFSALDSRLSVLSLISGERVTWYREKKKEEKLAREILDIFLSLPIQSRAHIRGLSFRSWDYARLRKTVRVLKRTPRIFVEVCRQANQSGFYPTVDFLPFLRRADMLGRLRKIEDTKYLPFMVSAIMKEEKTTQEAWADWVRKTTNAKPEREDHAERAADRRARSSTRSGRPALSVLGSHYDKGNRLADLAYYVIEELGRLSKLSNPPRPIVIYGRDCEVFYTLMKELKPSVPVSYVLAPRPLTTERGGGTKEQYKAFEDYLRRRIPPYAIHFDSGFSGSIPDWIRNRLKIPVHSIALISSSLQERCLFDKASMGKNMREIVINEIEHVPHRLQEATTDCWRAWQFDRSGGVEQYYARLSGMRDGIRAISLGTRKLKTMKEIAGTEWTPGKTQPEVVSSVVSSEDEEDEENEENACSSCCCLSCCQANGHNPGTY